jgi:AAA+ superfamily predicted ATPase
LFVSKTGRRLHQRDVQRMVTSAAARAAILRIILAEKPTGRINFDKLARMTEGFSGADLKDVVDQAVEKKLQQAMKSGIPEPLPHRDLQAIVKTVRPTIKDWLATARNYAIYANQSGLYDDILVYLNVSGSAGMFS